MSKFNQYLTEQLKDSSFKAEYDALEAEFAIIQAMITARQKTGMTQKQLAERTGIHQSDINNQDPPDTLISGGPCISAAFCPAQADPARLSPVRRLIEIRAAGIYFHMAEAVVP